MNKNIIKNTDNFFIQYGLKVIIADTITLQPNPQNYLKLQLKGIDSFSPSLLSISKLINRIIQVKFIFSAFNTISGKMTSGTLRTRLMCRNTKFSCCYTTRS
jgi:hypothetical protein